MSKESEISLVYIKPCLKFVVEVDGDCKSIEKACELFMEKFAPESMGIMGDDFNLLINSWELQ